ncbi:hypothetical protein HHI36_019318 [Cryptolaemus montrouzieri]|uniref:Glutathione S-transferase n=1 Tax=Cryptolaemus montrouzieri TaxID=559131 RepID=A0ABD2P387_9CUCU
MTVTLFYSPICPPARSVLLVAKALGLKLQLQEVDLLSNNYRRCKFKQEHPEKTIPTLRDGNHLIWDSHAISEYLINQYGRKSDLRPQNIIQKAHVDRWLHFDTEYLVPLTCDVLIPILFHRKYVIANSLKSSVKKIYGYLNTELSESTWLTGASPTIADLCCITSLSTLDLIVPVKQKTKLFSYIKQFRNLPYYQIGNQDGLNQVAEVLMDKIILNKYIL